MYWIWRGSALVVMYGRSEEGWDKLADAGLALLAERARLVIFDSVAVKNAGKGRLSPICRHATMPGMPVLFCRGQGLP
jgi:hypothetical protein